MEWATAPQCGAVVVFCGTVRDHAPGRPGVTGLMYEAYRQQASPRLVSIADSALDRWADLGRLVLLHRTGDLVVGEVAVVVVAAAPHRSEAFAAARWSIDAVKATVPIWKREQWSGGDDWGTCTHDLVDVADLPQPSATGALHLEESDSSEGPR
jgi:molybdopterin synthase catalytic subunit